MCARPAWNPSDVYGDSGHTLFISPSIDVLIRQPHVSGIVNRAALADYLLDRFPILDETFFSSVRRVPPGNVLRVVGEDRRTYRYWDPAPEGSITWIRPADLGRFDELLDAAVRQALGGATALAGLGIIDRHELSTAMEQILARGEPRKTYRIWSILNAETW